MSRGPHTREPLPLGFWKLLQTRCSACFGNTPDWLERFCAAPPTLSLRTLRRAYKSGITLHSLAVLATKLGFSAVDELLISWSPERLEEPAHVAQLSTSERAARYEKLMRESMYAEAAGLAIATLVHLPKDAKASARASWENHEAEAHRASGMLRESSAAYARAWQTIQQGLAAMPDDAALRYEESRTRFGRIMVDDRMVRGRYSDAFRRYGDLLDEMRSLIDNESSTDRRSKLQERVLNTQRHQAQMLRLMGRYAGALQLIEEVIHEYHPGALEEICWARLLASDCRRLLGAWAEALVEYDALQETARSRGLADLLGSILWRKAGVYQQMGRMSEHEAALEEVSALSAGHGAGSRFTRIYALLSRGAGAVTDKAAALTCLSEVESFGPLREDFLVPECAHLALCRGEIARRHGSPDGRAMFKKALRLYQLGGCSWGIVRAGIGVLLTGGRYTFATEFSDSLEGVDRALFLEFASGIRINRGVLSMGLP
jgi:tetratricopeptide (TPR) repeat protein